MGSRRSWNGNTDIEDEAVRHESVDWVKVLT